MTGDVIPIDKEAAAVPAILAEFAKINPEASVTEEDDRYTVSKPWGDDTLSFNFDSTSPDVIDALNSVRLPPRLSAVWHRDTCDLEIVYGFLNKNRDECNRSFRFHFKGSTYQCEYALSSDRLKCLALAANEEKPPSETSYRNIVAIRHFLKLVNQEQAPGKEAFEENFKLISFWIRGLKVNEDELTDIARHLNFYMVYFDRRTPTVLLHHDAKEKTIGSIPDRYPKQKFPDEIRALEVDQFLLGLWEGARRTNDTSREYIYHYQILEYLSFYFIREEISKQIRKIIRSPDIDTRFDEYAKSILDIVTDDKVTQDQKIHILIKDYVNLEDVWEILEKNKEFFSTQQTFDGGLALDPLFDKSIKFQTFSKTGALTLSNHFKTIRNHLVHARESRHSGCITSSRKNDALLRPWIWALEEVTKQLITYAD